MKMKKQMYNTRIMLLIILFMTGISYTLSGQQLQKVIAREYQIKEGFSLGIDNKYGEINIVNWNRDELSVEVVIEAESGSKSNTEELMEAVDIDISENQMAVDFLTKIEIEKMSGNKKIKVIYNVKAPAYLNVKLSQSYGNIYIQDITGTAELKVKYGNLTATTLQNSKPGASNILYMAYGKAFIEVVSAIDADVKYSELSVSNSKSMSIQSAYSKVFLEETSELNIKSKYDHVEIGSVREKLIIDSDYTQVVVDFIHKGFSEIMANMTYGNFKGIMEENTPFRLDASVSYGSIQLPDEDSQIIKRNTSQEFNGNIGGMSNSNAEFTIRYGKLLLK
jgi:hypothetical protein